MAAALEEKQIPARIYRIDCGQEFVPHGAVRLLKRDLNLDGPGIARRAMEVLGWQPKYTNVEDIIASAWKWHSSHPDGYGG